MALKKEIGKIQSLRVGHGGRDDCMFGVDVVLAGSGWGVVDFKGMWSAARMGPPPEYAKWGEAERDASIVDTFRWLDQLLKDAKVRDVRDLVGKPIEATFDGNMLMSWRILTEAL